MGRIGYRDGIAISQLVIFPLVFVAALIIWKRTGWKEGRKSWRFIATLSLLRVVGAISTLLSINSNNESTYIAEAVCELIGIAPLVLAYVGLVGQIDSDAIINPRLTRLTIIVGVVGLILGIAGVSTANRDGPYQANDITKVAMVIFIAVFAVMTLMAGWLFLQLQSVISKRQKYLFMAILFSWPFLLARLAYSAIADFSTNSDFAILTGNSTIYLCMNVLEEMISMGFCVVFGILAVREDQQKHLKDNDRSLPPRGAYQV